MGGTSPNVAIAGLRLFLAALVITLAISPHTSKLFLSSHGRSHRLVGAAHLAWLLVGAAWLVHPPDYNDVMQDDDGWAVKCLVYDILLGILGILATITAARDFPHRHIINRPGESGTLSSAAVVTQGEMIEHAFYQGLNLWQALYLHAITWAGGDILRTTMVGRGMLLWVVTLPWAVRRLFPVNSFSANWADNKRDDIMKKCSSKEQCVQVGTERGKKGLSSINRMYQVKKWQYVFYKHVILHGLNVSMAFPRGEGSSDNYHDSSPLPLTCRWRVFWLALNTSYVMEFFLQSIVKRGILSQRRMVMMNGLLMAVISILLNFSNRRHDTWNMMATGCIVSMVRPCNTSLVIATR